jgi:hypothetical protein
VKSAGRFRPFNGMPAHAQAQCFGVAAFVGKTLKLNALDAPTFRAALIQAQRTGHGR